MLTLAPISRGPWLPGKFNSMGGMPSFKSSSLTCGVSSNTSAGCRRGGFCHSIACFRLLLERMREGPSLCEWSGWPLLGKWKELGGGRSLVETVDARYGPPGQC